MDDLPLELIEKIAAYLDLYSLTFLYFVFQSSSNFKDKAKWSARFCFASVYDDIQLGRYSPGFVKYFWGKTSCYQYYTCKTALEEGNIELLEWIGVHKIEAFIKCLTCIAINAKSVDHAINTLNWLYTRGCKLQVCDFISSCNLNRPEINRWLKARGVPRSELGAERAAINGHLDLFVELHTHSTKCKLKEWISSKVTESGHLHILKEMTTLGCNIYSRIVYIAVEYRQLEILQWIESLLSRDIFHFDSALESSYIWECAVRTNDLRVLEWLYTKQPSPTWNELAMINAVKYAADKAIVFLLEKSCPSPPELFDSLVPLNNVLLLLETAKKFKVPWSQRTTYRAAVAGELETFIWLVRNGCPVDFYECQSVAKNDRIVRWITEELS